MMNEAFYVKGSRHGESDPMNSIEECLEFIKSDALKSLKANELPPINYVVFEGNRVFEHIFTKKVLQI